MILELVFILSTLVVIDGTVTGDCSTGDASWQYGSIPYSAYTSVDTDSATGYLMDSVDYHVPEDCTCKVLYKWHFYAVGSGDIQLQVWERQTNDIFKLMGENYLNVPSTLTGQTIEFYVPIKDRITVRNGYLIGWYTAGSGGIVGYKTGAVTYPDEQRKDAMGDLSVGGTYDWLSGTSTVLDNRVYAFGASVTANTAPGFTNLPRCVNIYKTWQSPAFIYQVAADDIDEDDVSSLVILSDTTATGYFNFSMSTKKVDLSRSYPTEGPTLIVFTVSDQCGGISTATLTITVLNWAPTLNNLPAVATISEDTTNEVVLHVVTFSDSDDTTLTDSTVTISNSDIEIKNDGHDVSNRSIISKKTASWSYPSEQINTVDITLTDGTTTTNTGKFILYVTKNDPPKFTNLGNTAHANVSYLTTETGDVVYSVSTTDAEQDTLTFTITCAPLGCPLVINSGGVITATTNLIRTYTTGYDVVVGVSDAHTTITSKTVTVIVKDIDYKPQISNLPIDHPLKVFEGTALATTIFTVSYNDLDTTDTHTVEATFTPTWGLNYFAVNINSGIISTANNIIDYEEVDAYSVEVVITVSDGQDSATASLTILIGNVNEAPSFHQTRYTLEPPEEGTAGLSAGDPEFEVNDPDLLVAGLSEAHTYEWNCGTYSRYFVMARSNGAITFATTFDYDTANVTVPYNCTVTVTDKAGLSATTMLEIDIQDNNDNLPVFTRTTDYYIFQSPTLADGRFVGQVSATDADRSEQYGKIYYSFLTSPFSKGYLYINDYGNIYVNESWTTPLFVEGVLYELVVIAENVVDTAGIRLTATTTVTLMLPGTSTTTSTTTDRPAGFIGDKRNVAWVTVASAIGSALLITICVFLMWYTIQTKRYRWCIPKFRKKLMGLQKRYLRQKRQKYIELLRREELEQNVSDESEGWDPEGAESDNDEPLPPMWSKLKQVPGPARYDAPRPQLKREISGLLPQRKSAPKPIFWKDKNNPPINENM